MGLREKLEELRQQGLNEIANSDDLKNVNNIRVKLLGKKGANHQRFTRHA